MPIEIPIMAPVERFDLSLPFEVSLVVIEDVASAVFRAVEDVDVTIGAGFVLFAVQS
jgi:hypothetical protein